MTYGGRTPLEIAYGRRPPDLLDVENMMPIQLVTDPTQRETTQEVLKRQARKAHLEARQRLDLRRDLAKRLKPSDGPFYPGDAIWYWDRDQ